MNRHKYLNGYKLPRIFRFKAGQSVRYSNLFLDEVTAKGRHLGDVGIVKRRNDDGVVDVEWPGWRSTSRFPEKYLERVP